MAYNYNWQHLIWSSFERQPWINAELQPRVFEYIGGILRKRDSVLITAGGIPDHIHLLVSLHPTIAISDIVNTIKSNTSRWIHETFPELIAFRWQTKYGSFSVAPSIEPDVRHYIETQEEHHRQRTYQDEFRLFLKRHGLDGDERYMWE